jgi:N-acetylmuramic acid 6-phosphate etherase
MEDQSPTEAVLETTRDLDCWDVDRILRAIHAEDANAHAAVGAVLPQIAAAVDVLVVALGGGGTWFSVGAGTSGRIGVLDAAEIPPTFGLPPHRVQALIAGGERALWQAVEGAEDHPERAAWELRERGLSAGDVVLAISASGRTPYTLGALEAAHGVGARTIGLTCNPHSALAETAELAVVPEVGPEVIAGSTRMKGGLAQKMVLHMLSTATMVRLGHVSGNLMSSLTPASEKLWERAVRIIMALGGLDRSAANALLVACDGDVGQAARRAQRSAERDRAQEA